MPVSDQIMSALQSHHSDRCFQRIILQDVIDRNLRPGQAADMFGITPRHCSRLLKRYRQSGPLGMNNQSRGRTGNRLLPASLTELALNIIRERYPDFGPTLAREKLAEYHGIVFGKETLRRLMIKTGLWVPHKQRARKIQQPRYRRACCGELIQIDGCDHHWFENRAPACTTLVLQMSLWPITTGALRKRPGMILMFTGHLKLTITW